MNKWIRFHDCPLCDGYGWMIGGDEQVQCPWCRDRERTRLQEQEKSRNERRNARMSA